MKRFPSEASGTNPPPEGRKRKAGFRPFHDPGLCPRARLIHQATKPVQVRYEVPGLSLGVADDEVIELRHARTRCFESPHEKADAASRERTILVGCIDGYIAIDPSLSWTALPPLTELSHTARHCAGQQAGEGASSARAELPQHLLSAIYAGRAFRAVLRELRLTSNTVWGLAKTDAEWSAAVKAALTATRRGDLKHGANAPYVAGCACRECRKHQRVRMARRR
jgi:hypothetical protein